MAIKRVLREKTTVNEVTGETLSRETEFQFSKEPAYVKLYFDCLGVFIKNEGLTSSLNDMLIEVLKRSSYAEEGQIVHLDAYTKEQICKATHKSSERLKQAIKTWTDNKVLVRVARGVYQVNPFIFGRGDWRNVANLRANFNFRDGTVKVNREYAPSEDTKKAPKKTEIIETSESLDETNSLKAPEPLVCPECGERLELIDYDCDQKGWYVCTNRDCNSMFPPEEVKAS